MTENDLNSLINQKTKFTDYVEMENPRDAYVITTYCDVNDGDLIEGGMFCRKDEFEEDVLLKLVLMLVSKRKGKIFSKDASYGNYIKENKDIPWLYDYVTDNDLLEFSYIAGSFAHSIVEVSIVYYNHEGVPSVVTLPDFDDLFEDEKEAVGVLENLYDN